MCACVRPVVVVVAGTRAHALTYVRTHTRGNRAHAWVCVPRCRLVVIFSLQITYQQQFRVASGRTFGRDGAGGCGTGWEKGHMRGRTLRACSASGYIRHVRLAWKQPENISREIRILHREHIACVHAARNLYNFAQQPAAAARGPNQCVY